MSIRILINGAKGKMGQAAVKAVTNDPELTLVGEAGSQDNLFDKIKGTNANVVVDVTKAESVVQNATIIIEAGAHPVIGTSGLKEADVSLLQMKAGNLGGIIAPNFSLGAVLMMKYAAEIAKYFPQVEIIEMHHDGKLDSPSGTAVRTAEMINTQRQKTPAPKNIRETVPGALGARYQDVAIHSVRLPGLVAHQRVIFGGLGETLTLQHDSIDRQCFMPGLILCCKKVMGLNGLVYGLETIL